MADSTLSPQDLAKLLQDIRSSPEEKDPSQYCYALYVRKSTNEATKKSFLDNLEAATATRGQVAEALVEVNASVTNQNLIICLLSCAKPWF